MVLSLLYCLVICGIYICGNCLDIRVFYFRFKIDIQQECRRLLEGFSEVVNNADKYVQKTLHELRKLVDVPAWQKSAYWVVSCKQSLLLHHEQRLHH